VGLGVEQLIFLARSTGQPFKRLAQVVHLTVLDTLYCVKQRFGIRNANANDSMLKQLYRGRLSTASMP
jgi:hypothetical protein